MHNLHPEPILRLAAPYTYQTGNPERLSLYGTVIGDRVFEKEIHKELQSNRLNGEWFAFPSC
ncbi:GIY-YIG nuclease family protein, partial [Escherichia coli]|uniref:GIY-YIG nuclease family protein n=1 Tax=Escherichia coli TaxID=562 RepID=UPI003985F0BD